MPNWKRLAAEGYSASLASFIRSSRRSSGRPWRREWDPTSIASSTSRKSTPKTGQKVPVSGDSRAVPAVWNVASAAGKKVGVVGWWATHPAEEVTGFFVSDHASPISSGACPRRSRLSRLAGGRSRADRRARRPRVGCRPRAVPRPPAAEIPRRGPARGDSRTRTWLSRASSARRASSSESPASSTTGTARPHGLLPGGHGRHRPRLRVHGAAAHRVHSEEDFRRYHERSTPTTRSSTGSWDSGCAGPRRTGRRSSSTRITASSGAPTAPASAPRSTRRPRPSGTGSTASSRPGARG